MKKVVTPRQMSAMDRYTIMDIGIPGCVLMERAALCVAQALPEEGRVLVFCGLGNNGADGYALARILHTRGRHVVCFIQQPDNLKDDARMQYLAAQNVGVPMETRGARLSELLNGCDIVVDALFGTGLARPLRWPCDEIVAEINKSGKYVVSVDIPSGIDGETGRVMGCAVRAHRTVTMQFAKLGCCVFPGREYAGELIVADIGIPQALAKDIRCALLDDGDIAPKERRADTHKHDFGHVGVVAGSLGMAGAGALCAAAALRAGAGVVSWAVPEDIAAVSAGFAREVMTRPLLCRSGQFAPEAVPDARDFISGKSALAVGPGLGRGCAADFVSALAAHIGCPAVLDADALYAVAQDSDLLRRLPGETILTPHAGEMARLAGCTTQEILERPLDYARQYAAQHQVVVVLKGATTVIAAPDGQTALNTAGNAGMATAGSGDVLCGVIAAFLAQGLPAFAAACAGCRLHSRAGDAAERGTGMVALTAGDIIDALAQVLRGN
ncbi:MAG: NAD(P)H-hydrate dehydratase [Eubacteriales bacterium]|nr:NAD(P)H-hydrate dehydratase [Eubacteriales bacterium]